MPPDYQRRQYEPIAPAPLGDRRKVRIIGVIAAVVILLAASLVLYMRTAQEAESELAYAMTRAILIKSLGAKPGSVQCNEAVPKARELMRNQMRRKLINRKAVVYDQVLVHIEKGCQGQSYPEPDVPGKRCLNLEHCQQVAVASLLRGEYKQAVDACVHGLELKEDKGMRALLELVKALEEDDSGAS